VPQNLIVGSFEKATEQGVPRSANVPALLMGYTFADVEVDRLAISAESAPSCKRDSSRFD
jgi:hypothetical protein